MNALEIPPHRGYVRHIDHQLRIGHYRCGEAKIKHQGKLIGRIVERGSYYEIFMCNQDARLGQLFDFLQDAKRAFRKAWGEGKIKIETDPQ